MKNLTKYRIVWEFPVQGSQEEEVRPFLNRERAEAHATAYSNEWSDAGVTCRPLYVAEMLQRGA